MSIWRRLWVVVGVAFCVLLLPSQTWAATSPDTSTATASATGSQSSPSDPGSESPATSSPTPTPAVSSSDMSSQTEAPSTETETVTVTDLVVVTAGPATGSTVELEGPWAEAVIMGLGLSGCLLGALVVSSWGSGRG